MSPWYAGFAERPQYVAMRTSRHLRRPRRACDAASTFESQEIGEVREQDYLPDLPDLPDLPVIPRREPLHYAIMTTRQCAAVTLALIAVVHIAFAQAPDGFTSLFNGRDFTGWKVP